MAEQNRQLAEAFREVARGLAFQGESHFKTQAYTRFAERLEALQEPIGAIAERNELEQLPGVGEAISKKVEQWLETGAFPLLERIRAELPTDAQHLLAAGLAPSAVRAALNNGLQTEAEVKQAFAEGRLNHLPTRVKNEMKRWAER